ncbi:MAG: hypothetical protein ACW98X_22405 [Promethearchaeota archaeon]
MAFIRGFNPYGSLGGLVWYYIPFWISGGVILGLDLIGGIYLVVRWRRKE